MKKICGVIFFVFLMSGAVKAQFFDSWAVTGGVSYCNEHYSFKQPVVRERKKYLLGYNAAFFLEMLNGDYVRWVSEVQYNQKGAVDETNTGSFSNKLQYGCFNNYLKLRKELFAIIPYVLIGPRVEYLIAQNTSSPPVTENFNPFHVSAAFGIGNELVSYGFVSFFAEAFYNPDVLNAYKTTPLFIKNNNFEFRIGLKVSMGSGRVVCNVPRG